MRTGLTYIIIILVILFGAICIQLMGFGMTEIDIYNFEAYSWWEWTLQVIYGLISLCYGIILAEDYRNIQKNKLY